MNTARVPMKHGTIHYLRPRFQKYDKGHHMSGWDRHRSRNWNRNRTCWLKSGCDYDPNPDSEDFHAPWVHHSRMRDCLEACEPQNYRFRLGFLRGCCFGAGWRNESFRVFSTSRSIRISRPPAAPGRVQVSFRSDCHIRSILGGLGDAVSGLFCPLAMSAVNPSRTLTLCAP